MQFTCFTLALLTFIFGSTKTLHASLQVSNQAKLESLSLVELEKEQNKVENKLKSLVPLEFNEVIFRMGYRSKHVSSSNIKTWTEITLQQPTDLDQIYLVPVITSDRSDTRKSRGFPKSFTIKAGLKKEKPKYTQDILLNEDEVNRFAPLILSVDFKGVNWIRFEIKETNGRKTDGRFIFQLSEIFLMDQGLNRALLQEVKVPRHLREKGWSPSYLVDGHIPYNMKLSSRSNDHLQPMRNSDYPLVLTIDLEESYPIDELKIHGVDFLTTNSRHSSSGFGMPGAFTIEGSNDSTFKSPTLLGSFNRQQELPIGQVLSMPLHDHASRFIRLRITEPWVTDSSFRSDNFIRLSEIEFINETENVALGKLFKSSIQRHHIDKLSDGSNTFGKIIPIKEWMTQLSEGHDLELYLKKIKSEIAIKYRERAKWIYALIIALTLSCLTTIIILLRARTIRKKTIQQTRAMLGADLHDELGANLDALSLYSEMALRGKSESNASDEVLERIGELSKQSSVIAKKYSKLQDDITQVENLFTEIQLLAKRFTHGLEHQLELQDEELIEKLPNNQKLQLILFYRECLNNIIRHARAKKVKTHLHASDNQLTLTVCDNGQGLQKGTPIASSLSRRARILGGQVECHSEPSQGTHIILQLSLTQRTSWISKLYERFTLHSHH